jgi:apolipoprotein N-acyltransferase
MLSLADRVILASGWTRRLIALVAGAFGALAMAPVNIGPALIVPMVVAVWLLDGSSEGGPKRFLAWPGGGSLRLAFGAGWWLGFGYFLAGFWWLGSAFLMEPEFAWALPLGVVGLPILLAFFPAFGFVVARLLWGPGASRLFALALGLGLSEWLRGTIFTGFPWNSLGMALGGTLVTAQAAAVVGLDGLTLFSITLFAAPATLADGNGRLTWKPTLVALAAFGLLLAFGAARLGQTPPGTVPGVVVRIMQPGVGPDEKFRPENKDAILAHYFELSRRNDTAKGVTLDDVTLLVWPESAFPFILTRDPQALSAIGSLLPAKTVLVTGAAREEDLPATASHQAYSSYYNAIEVIGSGGTLLDSYDKIHLVPFGEYLPLEGILRRLGLRHFVSIPGGFEPGTRRRALVIPGLPSASPLICYEAIFPGAVMPDVGPRPQLLLNVTNDGWFGMTAGPSQHFAQARLRSIEEGLPMIRGAATGISAIVDPYGRVTQELPLGADDILDGLLPQPISATIFARYGATAKFVIAGCMLLTLLIMRERSKRRLT